MIVDVFVFSLVTLYWLFVVYSYMRVKNAFKSILRGLERDIDFLTQALYYHTAECPCTYCNYLAALKKEYALKKEKFSI